MPYELAVSQVKDYAIFMMDPDGRAASWNEGVREVLGWEQDEWIGQPIEAMFPPDAVNRNAHREELETAAKCGSANDNRWQVRKDGTRFFAQGITTAIHGERGELRGFLKVMRDMTEQRRAELRLETQSEVNRLLAEAVAVEEVTREILEIVCTRLGWQTGAVWIVDQQHEHLRLVEAWRSAEMGKSHFYRMSREMTFSLGVGLPGRVWVDREAAWIPDVTLDPNFPRRDVAMECGLRGALAFPIILSGTVVGVMEFLTEEVREPDPQLLQMMESVGRELGQFIQRFETQQELKRSEARSSAAVQTALDCIIGMDHEGRIIEFNPAAERVFGYSRGEVLGREMGETIIPPELCDAHRAGIQRYLATGEARVLGQRLEMPALRKNGERFLSELSITRNPGEPPTFTGFMRDISASRRAAEALAQSERRLRAVLEATPECVKVVGPDGTLQYMNPAGLCMIEAESEEVAIGACVFDLIASEHRDTWKEMHRRVCLGEKLTWQFEIVGLRGTRRWMETHAVPLVLPEGQVAQLGVTRDVTEQKRAEEDLRHQKDLLKSITDNAAVSLFIMNEKQQCVFMNPAAEAMTGFTLAEVRGKALHDVIHHTRPDGSAYPLAECPIDRAFPQNNQEQGEEVFVHKNGHFYPVAFTASPIRTNGVIVGTVIEVRDVTREKQAARERDRFLEVGADMLVLADAEGYFKWLSPAWERTLGWTPQEMMRHPWLHFVHPDDHDRTLAEAKKLIEGGETLQFENRFRCKDGSYRWISWRVRPYLEEKDGLLYGAASDVTERKQAEEAVRESAARLKFALESARVGDWDLDLINDTSFRSLLHDNIFGYSEPIKEWGFEIFIQHVHPDDRSEVERKFRAALTELKDWHFECRIIWPDGSVHWIEAHGSLYRTREGKPTRMLGIVADVTQRKSIEETLKETARQREELLEAERAARAEAERVNRMKDEFLTTLSHELRTPLNAILGWSQLLESGHPDEETLMEGLSAIARNARTQTQLIEDLLDMSRIISGKLQLNVRPVKLADVIEAALESVLPAARANALRVEKVLDTTAGPVSGDPTRLQQAIWNLLTNSVKFTPRGGKIQVLLERVNSHVEISVSDTGQGIKPEFLPFMFQRFRQADSSTTRRHGGLGIGLALVKQIVELHGGAVRVKSPGEGRGATFVISLPLSIAKLNEERDQLQAPEPAEDMGEMISLSGIRVLVVDDDPDARMVAKRMLERYEAQVLTAESAAGALELLRQEKPDVLVSDIGMPGVDGYELIRRVRELAPEEGGATPAAALTAFARSEDRSRALMAGYQSHIGKPVEPLELVAVVASLAGRTGVGA